MWKQLLAGLSSECSFAEPASMEELTEAERVLGVALPDALRELLRETNGVQGEYGLDLLWPLATIIDSNLEFRRNTDFAELYMPFEPLLFFADDGGGDQFAHTVLAGEVRRPDIFVWRHENDSRSWIAPSLRVFYEWWLGGRLDS